MTLKITFVLCVFVLCMAIASTYFIHTKYKNDSLFWNEEVIKTMATATRRAKAPGSAKDTALRGAKYGAAKYNIEYKFTAEDGKEYIGKGRRKIQTIKDGKKGNKIEIEYIKIKPEVNRLIRESAYNKELYEIRKSALKRGVINSIVLLVITIGVGFIARKVYNPD